MLAVSFGRLSSDRQGFKTANGDERSNLSRFSPGCDQTTHSRYAVIALPGMLFLPASEPADQEQSRLRSIVSADGTAFHPCIARPI